MRRLRIIERCALWGLLTIGLCGCTRTSEVKTSEKTAFQQELKGRERDRSTEVVQTGPQTVTTTVEEFAVATPEEAREVALAGSADTSSGAAPAIRPAHAGVGIQGAAPASPHQGFPLLVKRTVTVDQRGPVVATKTEVATKVESASLTEKQEKAITTKKRTSYWPPWLAMLGVAVAVGGAAYAAWRFSLFGRLAKLFG